MTTLGETLLQKLANWRQENAPQPLDVENPESAWKSALPASAVRAGPLGVARNNPASPPEVKGKPSEFVTVILGVAAAYTRRPSELGSQAAEVTACGLAESGWRPRSA